MTSFYKHLFAYFHASEVIQVKKNINRVRGFIEIKINTEFSISTMSRFLSRLCLYKSGSPCLFKLINFKSKLKSKRGIYLRLWSPAPLTKV
jgi:hypothetical protein